VIPAFAASGFTVTLNFVLAVIFPVSLTPLIVTDKCRRAAGSGADRLRYQDRRGSADIRCQVGAADYGRRSRTTHDDAADESACRVMVMVSFADCPAVSVRFPLLLIAKLPTPLVL